MPMKKGIKNTATLDSPHAVPGSPGMAGGGETHQHAASGQPMVTTNQGLALGDNQNTLRAGARGPVGGLRAAREDHALRPRTHS
jgi:hypothetical protein